MPFEAAGVIATGAPRGTASGQPDAAGALRWASLGVHRSFTEVS
jgi:hypothetical protein